MIFHMIIGTISNALRLMLLALFWQAQTTWGVFDIRLVSPLLSLLLFCNPPLIFRKPISKRHKCSKEYNIYSQQKSNIGWDSFL